MTTTFIIYNKTDDTAFRARYEAVTGERIQASPAQNADGTQYMVGSSRITAAQLATLQGEFEISTDGSSFVPLEV